MPRDAHRLSRAAHAVRKILARARQQMAQAAC
jgi:hypothetical protein